MKYIQYNSRTRNPTVNGTSRVILDNALGTESLEEMLNEVVSGEERGRLQRLTGEIAIRIQTDSMGISPLGYLGLILYKTVIGFSESSDGAYGINSMISAPFVVLCSLKPVCHIYDDTGAIQTYTLHGKFNYNPAKLDGLFASDEHLDSDEEYRTYMFYFVHFGNAAIGTDLITSLTNLKLEIEITRLNPSQFYLAEAGN
jgi:hypothetical protein